MNKWDEVAEESNRNRQSPDSVAPDLPDACIEELSGEIATPSHFLVNRIGGEIMVQFSVLAIKQWFPSQGERDEKGDKGC